MKKQVDASSYTTSRDTTDLSLHAPFELEAVTTTLNGRPRKTFGWKTPAEALDEVLREAQTGAVATTS